MASARQCGEPFVEDDDPVLGMPNTPKGALADDRVLAAWVYRLLWRDHLSPLRFIAEGAFVVLGKIEEGPARNRQPNGDEWKRRPHAREPNGLGSWSL